MAKSFPFFKFIATDWLTGDIVYEDLCVQGLFINICAIYWQRDGRLTIDEVNKRYKSPELLDKLKSGFIVVKKGKISIKFLDEQLRDAEHISKTNSHNGKQGGRPKQNDTNKRCFIYVLECSLDGELFYKIGATTQAIRRRFTNSHGMTKFMPYKYKVLINSEVSFEFANYIEKTLHSNFKKYIPNLSFHGHNECTNCDPDVLQYIVNQGLEKGFYIEILESELKAKKSEVKAKKSKEEEEKEEEEEEEINKNKKENKNNSNFEIEISDRPKRISETVYQKFTEAWFDWHKSEFGFDPRFGGMEGKKIKSIISYFEKILNSNEADFLTEKFKLVLGKIKEDEYLYKNCNLALIESSISKLVLLATRQNTNSKPEKNYVAAMEAMELLKNKTNNNEVGNLVRG